MIMETKEEKINFARKAMILGTAFSLSSPKEYCVLEYDKTKGIELIAIKFSEGTGLAFTKFSNTVPFHFNAQMIWVLPEIFIQDFPITRGLTPEMADLYSKL